MTATVAGNITTDREGVRPSPVPATVVMWASYAIAGCGLVVAGQAATATEALKPVTLWAVGALGVLSFVRHALLHRSDAVRMGWDLGRRNNFQIEVGMANLAWGLAALGAIAFDWGTNAQAAITLVFAMYLFQAFVLHAMAARDGSKDRHGMKAWGPTLATLAIAVMLGYFAIAALEQA